MCVLKNKHVFQVTSLVILHKSITTESESACCYFRFKQAASVSLSLLTVLPMGEDSILTL